MNQDIEVIDCVVFEWLKQDVEENHSLVVKTIYIEKRERNEKHGWIL